MNEVLALQYIGGGAFRPTLPARDLDKQDIDMIAARQQRSVESVVEEATGSGLYKALFVNPEAADAPAPALADMRKADLIAMAESMGLATGGNKADLVARIEAARASEAPADSPEAPEAKDEAPDA